MTYVGVPRSCRPPRPGSTAAAGCTTRVRCGRWATADGGGTRNHRGKTGLPDGYAAGHRWHPKPAESPLKAAVRHQVAAAFAVGLANHARGAGACP